MPRIKEYISVTNDNTITAGTMLLIILSLGFGAFGYAEPVGKACLVMIGLSIVFGAWGLVVWVRGLMKDEVKK